MSMAKTDIIVRTGECQEGVLCELYHLYKNDSKVQGTSCLPSRKGVHSSSLGRVWEVLDPKLLEISLYPGRQLLQKSQHREERNYLKDTVVAHRPRIMFVSVRRQLVSNGIKVVLTARDEKRGLEAVEKLKEFGASGQVVFHQLDVADSASVASLADFVNNAGVVGSKVDVYVLQSQSNTDDGVLSDSPRIVNVASSIAKLEKVKNEWAKSVFSEAESLTEEKIDEVLKEFLKDFKDGSLESKDWPTFLSTYTVSKAAVNAYTRILASKYPSFRFNSVCPGYVKTDMNLNTGILTVKEGAASPVKLALLPNDGPSGLFYVRSEESAF
ncbi:hypothetical protein FNV43_RR15220 [Rhamnella rubrinervis]|uniref:(+)-neomenthol dehydrogenase-like n=1 Tax=Rhamnella rubrinervis TaxID=2594499 RepID=A0A8K0ECI5_9ROSA|nr:hypothetical protein FNV43_RR15220 [Rhamnella rubrinervis]